MYKSREVPAIIVFFILVILSGASTTNSSFPKSELPKVSELNIIQENTLQAHTGVLVGIEAELWRVAKEYGLDYDRFYNLAVCESTLNPDAKGKAGEIGLFQFMSSTFTDYAERYNKVGFSVYNVSNQINLAAQMLANGKASEWTCKY